MTKHTLIKFFSFVLCLSMTAAGTNADKNTDRVDRIFARWDRVDSPGCALAIVQSGKTIYTKGYGMANLELDVPITPESVFYTGSVSKQFVAMCIALLAKQGKLRLDDDVRRYIPEIPDYGMAISIKNLIHHTSGLRDYLELQDIAGIPIGDIHENEVLELISRQKELNFVPGEEHLYSNSGYFLLAIITARVSGKSMRAYAEEHIFKPLGMRHSRFHDDYTQLIKNRASSYHPATSGTHTQFISKFDLVGSGGLYTSVADLCLWDQNFYHHKVGGKDIHKLMHTPGILNDGRKIHYAFALEIGEYRGLKAVVHTGSLGGYRSAILRFPDQKFTVICLANLSSINPKKLCQKTAEVYLSPLMQKEKLSDHPITPVTESESGMSLLNPDQLAEYQGDYYSEELKVTYQLVYREGKLHLIPGRTPRQLLQTKGKDKFSSGRYRLQFIRDEKDLITAFFLSTNRVRSLRFDKTPNRMD